MSQPHKTNSNPSPVLLAGAQPPVQLGDANPKLKRWLQAIVFGGLAIYVLYRLLKSNSSAEPEQPPPAAESWGQWAALALLWIAPVPAGFAQSIWFSFPGVSLTPRLLAVFWAAMVALLSPFVLAVIGTPECVEIARGVCLAEWAFALLTAGVVLLTTHGRIAWTVFRGAQALLQGDLASAESRWRAAVELARSGLGPSHPHTLELLIQLAGVLASRHQRAEHHRCLAEIETLLPQQPTGPTRDFAERRWRLLSAAARLENAQFAEAEALLERAAELVASAPQRAAEHALQASQRWLRAVMELGRGHYVAAEAGLRDLRAALGGELSHAGADWPRRIDAALAEIAIKTNRLADAETLLRQWSAQPVLVFPPQHDLEVLRGVLVARLLCKLGRAAEAEIQARAAGALATQHFGLESRPSAHAMHELGVALSLQSRWAEAESALATARDWRERLLGPSHPELAETLTAQADNLLGQSRAAEALLLLEPALALREGALGADHPDTVASRRRLAELRAERASADLRKPAENV